MHPSFENTNPAIDYLKSSELGSASYDAYRQECDSQSQLSRKQGIFTAESYFAALKDDRTVSATTETGICLPICTPLEHVPGFNVRFLDQTFPEGVFYVNPLLVSPEKYPEYAKEVSNTVANNGGAVFYEFSYENDYGTKAFIALVADQLKEKGYELELEEFEDPAVSEEYPEFKPAAMVLFEGNLMYTGARQLHENDRGQTASLSNAFWEGVERGEIPADLEEGSALYSGKQIIAQEGLINELWDIYKDRFSDLGSHYPVSLEDSFEEFVEMIANPDTMTAIAYANSKVACFTFLVEKFEAAPWLNANSLRNYYSEETPYYFPGIVARRDTSGRAFEVLYAIGRAAKFAKLDFKILYECTNHSAMYIPDIIEKAAEHSGLVTVNTKQLESIAYRALRLKKYSG